MARSVSSSALQSKLFDAYLTVDFLPMPLIPGAGGYNSPSSRKANNTAFQPSGQNGCSPGLLPLRRTRTHAALQRLPRATTKLMGHPMVNNASPRAGSAGKLLPPPEEGLVNSSQRAPRPTSGRDTLAVWAQHYLETAAGSVA